MLNKKVYKIINGNKIKWIDCVSKTKTEINSTTNVTLHS